MPTRLVGAVELRKALARVEPDLAKATTKEIKSVLKPIVAKARGFFPSNEEVPSGWLKRENAQGKWATRFYDQSVARRGVVSKVGGGKPNRKGWKSIASVLNKSAGGAIYETAGRKTRGLTPSGAKFISEISKTGSWGNAENYAGRGRHSKKFLGRAIFRAGAEDQGKATAAVQKALQEAEDKFYGRTK